MPRVGALGLACVGPGLVTCGMADTGRPLHTELQGSIAEWNIVGIRLQNYGEELGVAMANEHSGKKKNQTLHLETGKAIVTYEKCSSSQAHGRNFEMHYLWCRGFLEALATPVHYGKVCLGSC